MTDVDVLRRLRRVDSRPAGREGNPRRLQDREWTAAVEEWCELEPGHAGPHVASAARASDGVTREPAWWWLHWLGDQRHLGTAPVCRARLGDRTHVDNGHCQLPAGHVGRHTYEWDRTPATAHLDGYLE